MTPSRMGTDAPGRIRRAGWGLALAGIFVATALLFFFVGRIFPRDDQIVFSPLPPFSLSQTTAYDFTARVNESRFRALAPWPSGEPPRHPWADVRAESKDPASLVHVTLREEDGWTRRRSLHAPVTCEYEYTVLIPSAPILSFHYGRLSTADTGARFLVELTGQNNQTAALFSVDLPPMASVSPGSWISRWGGSRFSKPDDAADRWNLAEIDLKPWQGQRVRLRFRTEAVLSTPDQKRASQGRLQAFWGQPRMWGATLSGKPPDNLFLLVMDSLQRDALTAHGAKGLLTPHLDRLVLEGTEFQKVYSNAVDWPSSVFSLLESRTPRPPNPFTSHKENPPSFTEEIRPSLPALLRQAGYRTVAIGVSGPDEMNAGMDGFDEAYYFQRDGLDTPRVCRKASQWLAAQQGRPPFFLMVFLRETPGVPPRRFWTRSLTEIPWGSAGRARWKQRAQVSYLDEYVGRMLDTADTLSLWDRALGVLVTTRGKAAGARRIGRAAEGGLREEEVRILWSLKHPSLPAGRPLFPSVQLIDVAPTLLKFLNQPLASSFEGRAVDFSKKASAPTAPPRPVLIFGPHGKALIIDGHYKYIRQFPSSAEQAPSPPWPASRLEPEAIYDLWADPGERRNLSRSRRDLLARLRRAMDELNPDRAQVRLVFWDLQGQPVQGIVNCPGGDLWNAQASGPLSRYGSNEFRFEIHTSSGQVQFETWPPFASYILRLRLGQGYFSSAQTRVSKLGLPFFEFGREEWYDHTKFSWMEGLAEPRPQDKGPAVFLGRTPVYPDRDRP